MSASVNVVFSADPVALQITPAEGKLTEITSITISYTDDNGTAYSLVPVITDSEAVPVVGQFGCFDLPYGVVELLVEDHDLFCACGFGVFRQFDQEAGERA